MTCDARIGYDTAPELAALLATTPGAVPWFVALYALNAVTKVEASVLQLLEPAVLVKLPTANTTIPARMPRITMTIRSSTKVKPCSMRFLWSASDRG